ASLSVTAAIFGNNSQKRTPGIRVGMVPNGPRYSSGAFGFGSQVSSWLGPPHSQSKTTDLAVPDKLPSARYFKRSARDRPRTIGSPTWTNARRESVWQVRAVWRPTRSMSAVYRHAVAEFARIQPARRAEFWRIQLPIRD